MSTLLHPRLGSIAGLDHGSTAEYRGIKYASLEHKFADAVLFTNDTSAEIPAKQWGPTSVTIPHACEMEQGFIQHTLPFKDPGSSETECLNLNIVCPNVESRNLPVLVWVHGGGFALGANSWPHYDLNRFVSLSMKQGKPVIAVGINYRLGISGFLTSSEMTRAGFRANRGLHDQRIAFEWINEYIEGFGGSPKRITVAAGSAGSVGMFYHLHSPQPLFSQFASMAGTPLLMKPPPSLVGDLQYHKVLDALKIEAATEKERIELLLATPATEMLRRVPPSTVLVPIIDGDIVKSPALFKDWVHQDGLAENAHRWCSRILIGDCAFDANILSYMLPATSLATIGPDFAVILSQILEKQPKARYELLDGYGLDQLPHADHLERVLNFAQDIGFTMPVRTIAENFKGRAFSYCFNELNTWEGRWKGRSTHLHDTVFLFQNCNESLSDKQRTSAETIATHFIDFVNGDEPFPAYRQGQGGTMVYGLNGEGSTAFVEGENLEDRARRGIIPKLTSKIDLDVLSSIWDSYMATR